MGLDYSSVVHAPITDVFDWHAKPGAFHRLSPPWQPMRLIAEASSLEDGRATLALPGGLRWVAVHQPDGYDPRAGSSTPSVVTAWPRFRREWRCAGATPTSS